ncbi:MAG: hypothetical protein E7514_00155 [Ruminococcaceae bacterium]|nr:hypothetical protein [Oscillospiraceae bacterium]
MKNRILAVIAVITAITLVFCSCGKKEEPDTDEKSSYVDKAEPQTVDISLPYSQSDSLNPFFATGAENSAAAFLFCQPLFEIKSDYSAEPVIAESYETDASRIFITIREVLFSDSTSVTLSDVVYSFNLAKTSPAYSERLKCFESARIRGNRIEFIVNGANELSVNALCFPIVKKGTADSPSSVPTGSGTFVFSTPEKLIINPNSQTVSKINTVKLSNVKKLEYIKRELEIGNFNYLFDDLSEGRYERIVAENKTVTINNLVYVGMNQSNKALSSSAVRTALYYGIDRENISAASYQGYSKTAVTPFNPDLYLLKDVSLPDVRGDKQKCASILRKMGYNSLNSKNVLANSSGSLDFSLLVNRENEFRVAAAYRIAEELISQGIGVTVLAVPADEYQARIAQGNFELYIGEIKLTEDMNLSAFGEGTAGTGIDKSLGFFADYNAFRSGEMDFSDMLDSFFDDMIIIPICYRAGVAAYSKVYKPDFSYAPYNIYGNIENWEVTK